MSIKPVEVTDAELAWGKIKGLLPDRKDIPEEFYNDSNDWTRIISIWFFDGLPLDAEVKPKDDIDISMAVRHISAILKSYEPKHEDKVAGCAYLLSEFFEEFRI